MGRTAARWRSVVLAAVVAAGGSGVWADSLDQPGAPTTGKSSVAQSGEAVAKAEWGKISSDIKTEEDLRTIIGMHDRFLDKYPDSALADTVRNSQEVYEALLKADAKKFRGKWVPAGLIEVMEKTWRDEAAGALALYREGKFKEAGDAAKKVETSDRENGLALAIEGDAAYHQKAMGAARSAFEKLVAIDAGNTLAENNLAVLAFENKQMMAAMVHYTNALSHGSGGVVLVDNVAEMLHTYLTHGGPKGAAGDKNNVAYKELKGKAASAEGEIIAILEKKGLNRHGAVWVTDAQEQKIQHTIIAIKYQMAMLDKQYSDLQEKMAAIRQNLARAYRQYPSLAKIMDGTKAPGIVMVMGGQGHRTWSGTIDMVPVAQQQYQWETELSNLSQTLPDYLAVAEQLKELLAAADHQYTGVQKIMEPEDAGTPGTDGNDLLAKAARPVGVIDGTGMTVAGPGVTAGGIILLPQAATAAAPSATPVAVQMQLAPGVAMDVVTVTGDGGVAVAQAPVDTSGQIYTPPMPIYNAPRAVNYGPGAGSGPQLGLENGKLVVKAPPAGYGPKVGYGPPVETSYTLLPERFVVNYHPPVNEPLPVYRVPMVVEWVPVAPVLQQPPENVPLGPLHRVEGVWTYWRPQGPWAPPLQMQPNFKDDPVLTMPTMPMKSGGLGLVPSTPAQGVPGRGSLPGYMPVWVPITSVGSHGGNAAPWATPPSAPIGPVPSLGGHK